MTLGYARVSTDAQNLDRQKDLLKSAAVLCRIQQYSMKEIRELTGVFASTIYRVIKGCVLTR